MNDESTLFDAADQTAYGSGRAGDPELTSVYDRFNQGEPEQRFGKVLRRSIDEVLDGQRTGRYDIDDLDKTEKTYLGTKVEIVCRSTFGLSRGVALDYSVAGVEVDAKFSEHMGRWMIPTEAMGHLCLLMSADDHRARFSVGLVRIHEGILTKGGNQDKKRNISHEGRKHITWIVQGGKLPLNELLHMSPDVRDRILRGSPSGQQRVNRLFREVQQCMVARETVVTLGKQHDAPKRVRDARDHLRNDGIVVLGHQNQHPRFARELGLPLSAKGEWLAVRVIPRPDGDPRPYIDIAGQPYVIAREDEPPQPGPSSY